MFEMLDPAFDAIDDPIPPVPTDAYGCPGNPLPVQAIGFDLTADGTMLPSKDGAAAFVKIVRRFPGQPWQPWVQLHEEVFQVTCDLPTLTPQGLLRCSMATGSDPNQKRKRSNRYRLHLKATPDVYADPFGNSFYIRCSDYQPPDCQVDYPMHEDVVLAYEFHRKVLRISKVIEFDRDLRAMLAAAEVKDFVWR